ncbi:MAG: symmetrical bis(5'-nucleosyl)-tetraphosphatase [Buchnera aphidicola (Nurudea shiraii)]
MSTYLIGDVHGCYDELMELLEKASFDEKLDYLWFTGDLTNRGSKSLEVLRFVSNLGIRARVVLGNHDINLISMYANVKHKKLEDEIISRILKAKDIDYLIYWLRKQSFLQIDETKKIIMVHAGIHPFWNIDAARTYSKKLESFLHNKNYDKLLNGIFDNNSIKYIDNSFKKLDRLSFSLNVFTRMRYCYNNGTLDMKVKTSPSLNTSASLLPWFLINNISLKNYYVFFGHWASLKSNLTPLKIIPLDTGCCWGGYLSMFRFEDKMWFNQSSYIKKYM